MRKGRDLSSAKEEQRLPTGTLVREEELVDGRLHFVRLDGTGPAGGWVSVALGGKALLVRADSGGASPGAATCPTSVIPLRDGSRMPVLGLGVYRANPGEDTYKAVRSALALGYRLVDTAQYYQNEESVGKAIRDSGIPRSDIWVTTKLPGHGHGYDDAMALCNTSLRELGLAYVDLYLIHSPNSGKLVETWDALVQLQKQGFARSIGVSNFGVKHLEALEKHGRPLPVVNQIEMHPLVYRDRKPLIDYCAQRGIIVEAYGSVFSGHTSWLGKPAVKQAAANHPGKTPAQVLLRWGLQKGFQLIPKSVHEARLKENMDIFDFELAPAEVELLDQMRGSLGEYWDPLKARVDLGRTDFGGAQR